MTYIPTFKIFSSSQQELSSAILDYLKLFCEDNQLKKNLSSVSNEF